MLSELPLTIPAIRRAYAGGATPEAVVAAALDRLAAVADPGIFIHLDERDTLLAEARALGPRDGRPLWGIPYAVKDNIDVAGMPTTAACPDAVYRPERDAFVVARLRAAGAICLGKTNLDQFATGLVGTRTPYPVPRNVLDPTLVPGGSSSGSAVAVAHGIVAFALGTDTAGSGRVPAALNGVVGLKPSLGALSASGMLPACRTLDTISIFARSVKDARSAFAIAAAYDRADAYSRCFPAPGPLPSPGRLRIGVSATPVFDGDRDQEAAFAAALAGLERGGADLREIDFAPFHAVAALLYDGPWLAERTAALGDRLHTAPDTLNPVTRAIVGRGLDITAVDTFRAIYRLAELRRACEEAMAGLDLLCVPTIPRPVTLAEIAADPVGPNAMLGLYTNFVNLLDLCGVAVPHVDMAGGVTFLAPRGDDARCASAAASFAQGCA